MSTEAAFLLSINLGVWVIVGWLIATRRRK